MSDLISREKAFEVLTEYYHHRLDVQHRALREALARVPTADARIRELLEENARLRADLLKAKAMQFKLFMMLPADKIGELLEEYLEHYNEG